MKNLYFTKKLIYVGSLSKTPDRDWMWIRELSKIGWEVVPFESKVILSGNIILNKIKKRFSWGPEYNKLRLELINLCMTEKPDWLHFRLPVQFDKLTLKKLKVFVPIITSYFNDDPFSKKTPLGLNWKFRSAIPLYDIHFVYRSHNIFEFKKQGAKEVHHVPPMYDPLTKFIKDDKKYKNFIADVAFIGHWENDNRVKYLSKLKTSGLSLIIRGGMWEKGIKDTPLEELGPIKTVFGDKYNEIYRNVLAGICFFSKINRDSFTERALEIIATGGVLVCERTEEAMSYFLDGEEALFFGNEKELLDHIFMLKKNPEKRKKIQASGYKRLLKNKSTIKDRTLMINNLVLKNYNARYTD